MCSVDDKRYVGPLSVDQLRLVLRSMESYRETMPDAPGGTTVPITESGMEIGVAIKRLGKWMFRKAG